MVLFQLHASVPSKAIPLPSNLVFVKAFGLFVFLIKLNEPGKQFGTGYPL